MTKLRIARLPPALGRNPYMDRLYAGLREHGVELVAEPGPPLRCRWLLRARKDVDVLHFHWRPDKYYAWARVRPKNLNRPGPRSQNLRSWLRLGLFAWRLRCARLLGYRLVWTIHEVYPPETVTRPGGAVSRRVDRIGSRLLARNCDLLLAHDRSTAELARTELGRALEAIEVVPHASYLGVYGSDRSREEVRRELKIEPEAFVFLCFGAIRPDKSISLVLDAFRGIERPDIALVVAGMVEDAPSQEAVLATAAADARIRPVLEFVPHERVGELHAAADACVFGRSEPWTSGSMILALSLGVPVVAANLEPYAELTAGDRAAWLYPAGDGASLRLAMSEASADPSVAREKGRAALEQARRLPTWADMGELTAGLILQSCSGSRRRSTDSASARSAGVFTP